MMKNNDWQEKLMKAVLDGEIKKVYEYIAKEKSVERIVFMALSKKSPIQVDNSDDPEQMYLKGLVEGMKFYNDLSRAVLREMGSKEVIA